MFWKKKPMQKLRLGLDVKRCAECEGPERPCLVDGKPAMFHRWVEEDSAMLRINAFMRDEQRDIYYRRFKDTGLCGPEGSIEKLRTTQALIEWPDGSVARVKPEMVRFIHPEPRKKV
jgi:hypothetical protein